MNINRTLSLNGCWKMVNAIQNAKSNEAIRERCHIAILWLENNDVISNSDYDELMETVAYLERETY